nr:GGDEF domain-containing protein [Tianweitania aestuarii]
MVGERHYLTVLHTAHRDMLTGVLNRLGFAEALAKGADANAILLCDLDHFKDINDHYGHDVGDEVLRDFANRMRRVVEPADLITRLGGEEFLVASAAPSLNKALALAETLRLAAKAQAVPVGAHAIPFTISIGVAMRREQEDLNEAIKRADVALYQAKSAGRDRVSAESLASGHASQPAQPSFIRPVSIASK